MDEEVGHDMDEHVDGLHIIIKENEFSFKPSSSNDFPDNSTSEYSDTLDRRNLDRIGSSEQASTSQYCQEDSGITVSELTLKNYDTIVGTSNNRERMQTTQNKWQNLYQISGGSGISNLHGQTGLEGKGQAASSAWKDGSNSNEPLLNYNNDAIMGNLFSNDLNYNNDATMGNLFSNDDNYTFGDMLHSSRDYFKSSLIAKGLIHRIPAGRGSIAEFVDQVHFKPAGASLTNSVAPLCLATQHVTPPSHGVSKSWISVGPKSYSDGINLREWIDVRQYKANKAQSLLIFRQVLDVVHASHSHGVPLEDLRPSCFKLLGSCKITYLGSFVQSGMTKNVINQNIRQLGRVQTEKRPMQESVLPLDKHSMKKRKLVENMKSVQRWPQFPSRSGVTSSLKKNADDERGLKLESKNQRMFSGHNEPSLHASLSCMLEEEWYISPELSDKNSCTFSSNIYCLGVLLFELLALFDSQRNHAAAMQDLHHRILPPSFLSENPKEAGFCLWLLHPEPSLRPPTREILQSEFVSGNQEISRGKLLSSIDEEDEESELLSHFLSSLNEVKEKAESNLVEQIQRIEADIQEIEKRRPKNLLVLSSSSQKSELKLKTNFKQLESAYFSMRSYIKSSDSDDTTDKEVDPLKFREKRSAMRREEQEHGATDCLGGFFDGLCKYARFNKFKVRGIVRNGESSKSANVMCLSFDRDEDYLASGGVSKKIKIYDFQSLLSDSVDIHYPAVEMVNKSKLSCVCWNGYIRNYLASSDYDGTVKLWDAATGQEFSNFSEHSERAWSVDFSRVDPIKLASGSDDRSVKIWSINDKNSLCTIRSNANVCSVQFSDTSSHLLAFSSADYKTYCYDLRNVSIPWCVLAGHTKAVSYAKFLDAGTLVSASVDNTLKIWDLNKTDSNCLSRDACISTLRGHTNEKNFVGLSVADGYIACGSETNEVFAYYKSLPMPITAHKFGSIDPMTGKESEDDNGQFVTSVCWRRKSNTVVAANSSGSIKLLQVV